MSVRTMTAVWDLDLPDSDKIVLLALADCANDEGHCWPSVASLVRKCTKSERTIQGCIKRLVDEGHLTRREVPGKGCNYTVHPRGNTPAVIAPRSDNAPQGTTQTPAAAADKPSRTIITEAEASDMVLSAWNKDSEWSGLHKARGSSNSRKQQLRLRIKENGLDTMLEAVRRAHRSPFLRGEVGDGRKADFNIILQPKTLARVLEGFYGEDQSKREFSVEEQIASLERMIPMYEEAGRQNLVDQARDRIAFLRQPPDPAMTAKVARLVHSMGDEKSVERVAAR